MPTQAMFYASSGFFILLFSQDTVVWGGTHQNDWSTRVSEEDSKFIREGCSEMMPAEAKGAEYIK